MTIRSITTTFGSGIAKVTLSSDGEIASICIGDPDQPITAHMLVSNNEAAALRDALITIFGG